jgi:CHAT domain-containing protein
MGGLAVIGEEATRAEVQRLSPGKRVVHFASHGEFRGDQPLFSGLTLADGWLTTLDVFNMRLNAQLVTLSACQTGRSMVAGGDELIGLMRAFLYAGARSLVLSLWEVDDASTPRLMERFYQGLARGQETALALREAQLEMLVAGGRHAHPYFWAPFVLVGDSTRI